jgi:hypothetical protein
MVERKRRERKRESAVWCGCSKWVCADPDGSSQFTDVSPNHMPESLDLVQSYALKLRILLT